MAKSILTLLCGLVMLAALLPQAYAQLQEEANPYRRYGSARVSQYRVGVSVNARKGPVKNIVAMVAIPFDCDEQQVEIIEEDVSPECGEVEFRLLKQGEARQLKVTIPFLPGGQEAHAMFTYEVTTKTILPPEDTTKLVIPAKPGRDLKQYLGKSPFIETNHPKIRKLARTILAEVDKEATDWERVEAFYDYVQENIEYVEGDDKSALQTLKDKKGDCQNISVLFIALCRTSKIPARIVWVHEHNYAEFGLEDDEGKLHWFPVESSGSRAFGEMPLARTIMQKGDNFKVPERPRTPLRYASNFMVGDALPGSGKPKVKYYQDQL